MSGRAPYNFIKIDPRADLFEYDAKRGQEPARFYRRFLRLTGDFEGVPFELVDFQAEILDFVYGWTWREGPKAGQRRIRKVYLDGPKRLGKSPLLAGWGLFHLLFDDVIRPYVISTAATFKQAGVIFRNAKEMIELSPELMARAEMIERAIRVPSRNGLWEIASSLNRAASGYAPSLTLADELHEFPHNAAAGLDKAERNAAKRRDSLFILATNTGDDLESPWGQWRKRAEAVLKGEREEIDLLPLVFSAPTDADIGDPETWRQANPAIGTIASLADYAADHQRTIGDKGAEIAFRRLSLGQVVQDETAWLDYERWKSCLIDEIPDEVRERCELYVGVDLGPIRDITAIAYVYVDRAANKVYVEVDQFIPKAAAVDYEQSHLVPYSEWASETTEDGKSKPREVVILDVPAIDAEPQLALAQHVADRVRGQDLRLLCYDRYKADHIVYSLEKTHAIPCEPISMTTFGLGAACRDFESRLATGSISIVRNRCLNWQARHVSVVVDKTGFALPVKPGHGRTKGNGWKKIDGIVAILYGMARATRVTEQSNAQQIAGWTGKLRREPVTR